MTNETVPSIDPYPLGLPSSRHHAPGLAVAGLASLGAGAIHAAASGIHAEHPQLARLFIMCAILQILAGLAALLRGSRPIAAAVVAVNSVAVAGWMLTRLIGIAWIDGLETREAPQFADSVCAVLGAIAIGAALASLLVDSGVLQPIRLAVPGVAVFALTVPAMLLGGTHVHSHDESASAAGHSHESESLANDATGTTVHQHAGDTTSAVGSTTETTVHQHGTTSDPSAVPTVASNWPRPWDPTQPIDLAGVDGVTAEQQARATTLIQESLVDLPRWADTATAVADGYFSIGDADTGSEHYIKPSLLLDDVLLDPTQPESLVYTVDGDKRILAGAMFIASARPTDDPTLTDWAGPLMQWHNHGNLCWENGQVAGVVDANGQCAAGSNSGGDFPMVHVWVTPHPCGVFAALEGVGAGQAAVPDDQRLDMCDVSHDHTTPAASAAPVPYDPTKPIDLGGVDGVTLAQQAAAENLVAINLIRLPQWADYRDAEKAGFHSIGDGLTGFEHFVNWDWIDDDITLNPDFPESLVYQPQPDGSRTLLSAMFMLPSDVPLADVPNIGGALMQWHIHDNLCFTVGDAPVLADIIASNGVCPQGLANFPASPMIHVWITPHPCGPFAALEGVGAGQVAVGEEKLCDHAHGSGF